MQVKVYGFGAVGACPGMKTIPPEEVESVIGIEEDFPSFTELQDAYVQVSKFLEKTGFCSIGVPVKEIINDCPRLLHVMTNGSSLVDHIIAPSNFGERRSMELEILLAGPLGEVDKLSGRIRESSEISLSYCKKFGTFELSFDDPAVFGSVSQLVYNVITRKPKVSLYKRSCPAFISSKLTKYLLLPKFEDYVFSSVEEI